MRAVLLLALLLAGCDNPLGPGIPDGAMEAEPHAAYKTWFAVVEKDTGIKGDLKSITWYKVMGGPWIHGDGSTARGMWVKSGNRIFVADSFWTEGAVVLHEMLHAILQDPSHSHPLFSTQKYNIVPLR